MSSLDPTVSNSSPLSGFYSWTDTLKGVYYGPGSVKTALPKLLNTLGVKKALIVTGKSLYHKASAEGPFHLMQVTEKEAQTDVVKKVEAILEELDAWGGTFYEIGEHSPIAGIRNGIRQYNRTGCDCIVAVGGGSPVDASKAILYNIQLEVGGKTPPQIAIPTTLSAAEYSVG